MYTFYLRCGTTNRVTGRHAHSATQRKPSVHVSMLMEWSRHGGVRWRIVYILMHVHILTKVCEPKWDHCKTHSATQWHPCFHVTMHKGWSWIQNSDWHKYMHQCMYTFHTSWGSRNEGEWDKKHTATQGHSSFHVTMQTSLSWHWDGQVDMYTCTKAYTHSNQGCVIGHLRLNETHTKCYTEAHISPCKYANGVEGDMGRQVDMNTCPECMYTF